MRVPSRQPALSVAVVFVLVLILIALAALQIHWTDQVSHADRDRLRANLNTAVSRFQRDFYLQLLRICWAFRVPETGSETAVLSAYAGRYDDWRNASAYPAIIGGIFVWDAPRARLLRLNPISEKFEPAQWPPEFGKLRQRLRRVRSAALEEDSLGPRWILDEQSYTLIHPFQIPSDRLSRYAIVQLSSNFLWQRLAPEFTTRYFGPSASSRYTVAIIGGEHPVTALYRSSPSVAERTPATGDIVANLVPQPETDVFDPIMDRERSGRSYFPLARLASAGRQWKLVIWGSSGSVESAVRALHRRNLVVSFGVLLLLAVALSLVIVSAQSAHRLARAQIDFVAGVSHELRTPLTVICSAADNLADGMLAGSERVREYGSLIRDQGRRLSHIVNEVLSFAAGQAGRRVYRREPLNVAEAIETALAQTEIQSQNVTVEKSIEKDLPRVIGDSAALVECIQNLVSNAIRYGGAARWVRIQAVRQHSRRKEWVVISVEDRGIGIPARDLPHVFEPFYRGANVTGAQIHGTGLGLALAQKIARAMCGRLAVKSTIGKGSQFTLSLPVERKA